MLRSLPILMDDKIQCSSEALLGFDAREMFIDPARIWGDARRRQYLLRLDVPKPLSADPLVWPSVFGAGLPDDERIRLCLDAMPVRGWHGPNGSLWENFDQIRDALAHVRSELHWLIAVSWPPTSAVSESVAGMPPYREPTVPSVRDIQWTLLGFDVGDAGFTSGLSNCAYDPAGSESFRQRWTTELNEHHLFTDFGKAGAFKEIMALRAPEHAPSFVYALWRIAR